MSNDKTSNYSTNNTAPKAIIFDLYGTLIKFNQREFLVEMNSSFQNVRNKNKRAELKSLLAIKYESDAEMYLGWCRAMGVEDPLDEQIDLCRNIIEKHLLKISCFDGARSLLGFLKRRGFKLALLSNSAQAFIKPLTLLELETFFDHIAFSCNTGLVKPDLNSYLSICENLDVQPEDCLFIGDSLENDYKAPTSIGMKAVCLGTQSEKQDTDLSRIAFSVLQKSNDPLNYLIPSEINFESVEQKFVHSRTILLPDLQQGRYNLIGKTYLTTQAQEDQEFYSKRYLLPESAFVEESAYHLMQILGVSDSRIKLFSSSEPILLSSPALGKLWTPTDIDEVTAEIMGSHCAVAYLIGNADLRPRNTFVHRNGKEVKVTVMDLEHCLFDRALDLKDCQDTFSPYTIDSLDNTIEKRTKHRVLSAASIRRARRSFLPIDDKSHILAKLFKKGWLKTFEVAHEKVMDIELYLSKRIYQTPYLIIGTQSYRRAMASIDIKDILGRINENGDEAFEKLY